MARFTRLPALPRAIGTTPGPVKPGTWNALVDAVEALDKRTSTLTPVSSSDLTAKSSPNGFSFSLKRRGGSPLGKLLPFQVSYTSEFIRAAPGVIGVTIISDPAVLDVIAPTDGLWQLAGHVEINATTGALVLEEVAWFYDGAPSATSTDFYAPIAEITFSSGEVISAIQYTYGPILVYIGGDADNAWRASIL